MKQNSINLDVDINADGFAIGGGTTERKVTVTGGDVGVTGGGGHTVTITGDASLEGTNTGDQTLSSLGAEPAKGADDNYVTDAEKAALHSHSNKATLDNITAAYTTAEASKLAGIEASANNYTHPATHSADIITDGTTNKAYTATEKTKLSGIEANAEVNNISDVNATDLTDGGATTLHKHSYNNLDDKPTIPTLPVKASGAEIDTGTDDAKFATAKAIKDSKISFIDGTETLTNKRITSRVSTQTDDATAVIDTDACDQYQLTAIANATEFSVSGTPTNGQSLIIRYKDAGTAKALTYAANTFRVIGVTLPTTTVANKTGYIGCKYNSADSRWDVLAVGCEI
jgi:hypothetical protein